MFRTSRPVVSNLLLLAAFILGAAALLAPRHVATAPAAQAQELMFRVTAGAVEGPRQVQAGLVTFVVENATGEAGFGVFLARLKAGKTLADVEASPSTRAVPLGDGP